MEPAYVFSALMFHKAMGKLQYETKQTAKLSYLVSRFMEEINP